MDDEVRPRRQDRADRRRQRRRCTDARHACQQPRRPNPTSLAGAAAERRHPAPAGPLLWSADAGHALQQQPVRAPGRCARPASTLQLLRAGCCRLSAPAVASMQDLQRTLLATTSHSPPSPSLPQVQHAVEAHSTAARPAATGDLALALAQVPGVRVALRSTGHAPSDDPALFLRRLDHTHIVCSNAAGAHAGFCRLANGPACLPAPRQPQLAPTAPPKPAPARPSPPRPAPTRARRRGGGGGAGPEVALLAARLLARL
jgi:hypothetical protein